jgi:hypothetical protein
MNLNEAFVRGKVHSSKRSEFAIEGLNLLSIAVRRHLLIVVLPTLG